MSEYRAMHCISCGGVFAAQGTGDICPLCGSSNVEPNNASTFKVPTNSSDGSTASYYQLPANATELQDLISFRNMNAQLGEIFRAAYRYGQASHSDCLRDARKIKFYAEAEIARLEKYGEKK